MIERDKEIAHESLHWISDIDTKRFKRTGFNAYGKNIFYNETGQWISNFGGKTLEEFAKRCPKFFGDCISEGMELAIGIPAPRKDGKTYDNDFGLYCVNWKEILQAREERRKGQTK